MTVDIAALTNATTGDDGTGIFDVLMKTAQLHLEEQYAAGRIKGADYATVYLGAMQTVMGQAIQYVEVGSLIDLKRQKLQEEIDLVIAQTAAAYEGISASQADTTRKNALNQKQVIKTEKEAELLTSQNAELLLNGPVERTLKTAQTAATTSGALDNTNKVNAEVALTNAQEVDIEFQTASIRPEEVLKLQEEIDLLQSRDLEQIASTARLSAESTQKVLLMQAQTQGFVSDTKQKVLKQMLEGYAVNLSIAGTAITPDATEHVAIDSLANEILGDIGSLVVIT